MSDRTWREDATKLEEELAKLARQVNGAGVTERKLRIEGLREGLEKEGVTLDADDEEIIERFSECHCTFDDLCKHFQGRFP